jgi:prepilin-type N-terminal cleavage/methylation domain-containing protein
MKNKGFTLVELLAVIVIMGIILLVAVPSVFGISKTVKDNMFCTKVHNLESAAKLYGNDYQDDFDDRGYIKVDVKTIIDNNLYKKEIDDCVLGNDDNGCVIDPRDDSVMDNNTITIVKTGSRFYAYYDFINEEDIALCEGKKEVDKFKHYDVALDGQGATYPGTTIIRDVIFGHEMPNIEAPRREYKVRLIDEYNHLDKTEIVKYSFRG